jgi:predicted GIY-YIG superfamily endonuclease
MNYYYVYILASKKDGELYIGVTNNILRRVFEHRHNIVRDFQGNTMYISSYILNKLKILMPLFKEKNS